MNEGLKAGTLTFLESLLMGVGGTAPGYTIAFTTIALLSTAGTLSAGALIIFAIPVLGIALAYRELNRLDANAGAAYLWTTVHFGRFLGYFSGWALLLASIVFVVSGSVPLATYTLDFIDPKLANNVYLCTAIGTVWFLAIAGILIAGISVTSRVQMAMTSFELVILTVVGGAAIWHGVTHGVATPFHWSWFGLGYTPGQFASSALIVVFFYWGWDVTANLAEETKNAEHYAGHGGFVSVFITVAYYLAFVFAVLFLYSLKDAQKFDANIIYNIAISSGFGRAGGLLASFAIILSSIANLETTMLGFSRTLFAMSRDGAMPRAFATVHMRTRTPVRAMIALIIFGVLLLWGSSFLPTVKTIIDDSVRAVGVLVCYYYGLAGLVAARAFAHFRKTAVLRWCLLAVFPAASGVLLIVLGIYAMTTFDLTTNIVSIGGLAAGLIFFRRDERKFEEAETVS